MIMNVTCFEDGVDIKLSSEIIDDFREIMALYEGYPNSIHTRSQMQLELNAKIKEHIQRAHEEEEEYNYCQNCKSGYSEEYYEECPYCN